MFKKTATYESAMGLFSKAQAELKEAQAANNEKLAAAQAEVTACTTEAENITRASGFLDSILGTTTA